MQGTRYLSHELVLDQGLQFLEFLNDLWIHQVSSFPNKSAFTAGMISIHDNLNPGVKLLWCPIRTSKGNSNV